MATSKQIRISITSALNAAGIEATKEQVASMSRSVQKSLGEAAKANRTHWADIKAAWDMGTAAIRKAWGVVRSALSSAFHFETQTNQFKTLIGNIDDAKAHMADLKALGDTPPFNLDQFAKASRALMVMTDGALGYKKSLELIGDAAAATGHPIEEMGQAVGRLYAFIRDGQPLSRAVMQLRNMGVITPEVAQKLQDLQAAGKSNAEIWAEVEAQLGRYKGAMKETEATGDGLMGAIKSRWDNIVRAFGDAFAETAKGGMSEILDKMKELEESDAIGQWADDAVESMGKVAESAKGVATVLGSLAGGAWKGVKATVGTAWAFAAGMDEAGRNGEGWFNFSHGAAVAREYWRREVKGEIPEEEAAADAEAKKERAAARAERRREREAQEARRAAQEEERIQESLAEGQRKTDETNAKAAAEKRAAEEKKAAEKAAAERARLDAQEAARRERERQKELADRIKDHQKLLAAERAEESKSRAAVSAAESKLQQAWGWYRDKESMRTQLEEEKAEAAAQKQYEKDLQRLKDRRRDWRKAENLSVDEEAVRRVALAREEKEAAEKHLAEIEKNTADLAAKLDELLSMK